MKKLMLILFTILMIISLSACGEDTAEPTAVDTEAPEAEKQLQKRLHRRRQLLPDQKPSKLAPVPR